MPTYREDLHSGHKVPLVESDDILKGGIKTENIADEAVTSEKLADKAVTNNKIADEAVTERTLGDGAVTSSKIAADSVTENKIVDGAVTSEKIAPKAVTADKIEQDAVDASKIADGAVVTSKMPDGAITTAKIDDGAVTEGKIGNQAVTADKIASGAVTGGKIADGTIQNAKIHDGAITGDKLADNTIGGEKIMANSIPGSKLAEGAITSVDIQDNTLDGSKLVNGSVSGEKLVDGAITSQKLMDNTIDGSKIADSTIQNLDIRDGSIPGSKLADDAITSEKIADGAITNAKIADGAVTGLKFVDESISGEKIANGTITGEKIARETLEGVDFVNGSIDGSKIKGNSVDGSKLADGAVDYMHLKASSITNDKIADDAVSTEKIKNNTITGAKFADNSITTDKLDGTFSGQKIADNTLVGSKIVDNTITGDKIVDNTVPGSKLQDGTIQGVDIQDGTLSGAKLVDGSVSGAKIADNAITSSHLLNNSIPGSKIQDGTIENVDLKDGTLDGSKLKDNTIQTAKIADSAVTGAKLAANAVTTDKIDAGAVTTAKIANEAVTEAKIDDDAVTSAKIASGAVTTDKILNDAVTTDKIDSGAVTTSKIADTAVTEGKIDTGAVTEGKIASNAVTNTKIADGSVTEGKIGALAVTEGKIASNAVTEGKIAAGAVSTAKLADGSVTAGKIVDANVTTAKIADDAVTEAKLADGAITSDKIADDTITELQTIMDDVPTKDSVKPISSGGVLAHGSALDVSLLNADTTTTPITLATYADLSAALAAIPAEYQSGGMSIKYVLTSDNKYVQYRLMSDTFNTTVANWQGVDDEPTAGSNNIVISENIYKRTAIVDILPQEIGIPQFYPGYGFESVNREYIVVNTTPIANSSYMGYQMECRENDIITLNGLGGTYARGFFICDAAYNILLTADNDSQFENFNIVLPKGTKYIIGSLKIDSNPYVKYAGNIDELTKNNLIVPISGKLYSDSTYGLDAKARLQAYKVNGGDIVRVVTDQNISTTIGFAQYYNGKDPVYSQTEPNVKTISAGKDFTYIVPSDANLLLVNISTQNGSVSWKPKELYINGVNVLDGISTALVTIQDEIDTIQDEIGEEDDNIKLVSLDNVGRSTQTSAPIRVSTLGFVVIPESVGKYLKFILPNDISCEIAFYDNLTTLLSESGYKVNGQSVQIPNNAVLYRLSFRKGNGTPELPLSEINGYINAGTLKITSSKDVLVESIFNNNTYLKSALIGRHLVYGRSELTDRHLPTIIHITDVHGDAKRADRAYQLSKLVNADVILNTGDTTYSSFEQSKVKFMEDIDDSYNIPSIQVVGNHDANGLTSDSALYSNLIAHYAEKYNYSNPNYPYYYYDISNIRVIVLNNYEGLGNTPNWGQTQIDWLISTLSSIPEGYGVILTYHKPCASNFRITAFNETFVPDVMSSEIWDYDRTEIIPQIIDAFISKTTINTSFTQNEETISVVGDFTNVLSNEFIAHIFGHTHVDFVGYINDTNNRQVTICKTCDCADYGSYQTYSHADEGDIPRGFDGNTQDAVNVIVIDRENHKIKIARFGSNVSIEGKNRTLMSASYI